MAATAARALSKEGISFGLVNIPIQVFIARQKATHLDKKEVSRGGVSILTPCYNYYLLCQNPPNGPNPPLPMSNGPKP
jgi:hypothetical protein